MHTDEVRHSYPTRPVQFVVTVRPEPCENLVAFVTRALSHTSVTNLSRALRLAGIEGVRPEYITTTLKNVHQISRLADLLGVNRSDIEKLQTAKIKIEHSGAEGVDFFGLRIRARYQEHRVRRVSPRALSQSNNHRAAWQLRPLGFDPDTREVLLSACPVCGKNLGWTRCYGPSKCDRCVDHRGLPSVDLREFPQPMVEVADPEALAFVGNLISPERRETARRAVSAPWAGMSDSLLFEALVILCSAVAAVASTPNGRSPSPTQKDFPFSAEDLARSARVILSGQKGFDNLAAHYVARRGPRADSRAVPRRLGALSTIARDKRWAPEIRSVVSHLLAQVDWAPAPRALGAPSGSSDEMLDAKSIAERLHIGVGSVLRLAKSGLVNVITAQEVKKAPIYLRLSEVEKLVPHFRDAVWHETAAIDLGIRYEVLDEFARASLIKACSGPVLGLLRPGAHYSKNSIIAFKESLLSRVTTEAVVASTAMSIVRAARRLPHETIPWVAIVKCLLRGEVGVSRNEAAGAPFLSTLTVPADQRFFDAVAAQISRDPTHVDPGEYIRMEEAAEMLRAPVPFVYRMARCGVLKRHSEGRGRLKRSEVIAFSKEYLFGAELRTKLGVTASQGRSAAVRTLAARPVFRSLDRRDLVFRRDDIPNAIGPQDGYRVR